MGLPFNLADLLAATVKRKVFVSYHHDSDQAYYDAFSNAFSEQYEVIRDNSLGRLIDSEAVDYVMRTIRENHIAGSSCTVVLCGPQTAWRKYVDWEIKATLDKQHGLIGVDLPNNPRDQFGNVQVPARLNDNIASGFALWIGWDALVRGGPAYLKQCVEISLQREKSLIVNSRALRGRNGA